LKQEDHREGTRGFWGIVAAQFSGAFNDNALRWFLIAMAMKEIEDRQEVGRVMTMATVLFLTPYLLFSMHAGSLADHFSKRKVLMISKLFEVMIMGLCVVVFLLVETFDIIVIFLLAALFLLGTQATYYSPAKFGILPEILPERLLSWGNGVFEMTGVFAIILGTICGAEFVGFFREDRSFLAPVVFGGMAIFGFFATFFVPRVPAAAPSRSARINSLRALMTYGSKLVRHRVLLLTLLSVVYVWSLGLLFQLSIALYGKENLGLQERHTAYPMGVAAIGVGVGNIAASYLSGKTIEMGLLPVASVGMSLSAVALYFTPGSIAATCACVGLLGLFTGLFVVPTHSMLQEESADEDKGGIWAATNFLQTLGMLVAAGIFELLHGGLGLSPPVMFLLCGVGTLATAVGLMVILPESIGRMLIWPAGRKVRVVGQDNVPPHGPVIFLINGPPRREGFLLLSGTRRFVRFVLPRSLIRGFVGRSVAQSLKAIAIGNPAEPEQVTLTRARVEGFLRKGDAVCLFAGAGSALLDGANLPESAILQILKASDSPVLPVTLERKGGSRVLNLSFEPSLQTESDKAELIARLSR